jgi:hypothetical protein
MAPRFADTHCSQCGKDLGPGDHGVSHCEHHGATSPQSCYAEEIETLRVMVADERTKLERWSEKPPSGAAARAMSGCMDRIEALTTAIEALGGAL